MENKEKILQCALDLFYARGYDAVSVQEIVEKAGITKPTLYYYFGSKLGLLETLLNTRYELIKDKIRSAAGYDGNVPNTLCRLAEVYIDIAIHNRKEYMLMMALFYSAKENEAYGAVRPVILDFYKIIVNVFEEASGELGNMNGRQEQFAIGFIGIINHYILLACEKEEEVAVNGEAIQELVRQFMYGIYS